MITGDHKITAAAIARMLDIAATCHRSKASNRCLPKWSRSSGPWTFSSITQRLFRLSPRMRNDVIATTPVRAYLAATVARHCLDLPRWRAIAIASPKSRLRGEFRRSAPTEFSRLPALAPKVLRACRTRPSMNSGNHTIFTNLSDDRTIQKCLAKETPIKPRIIVRANLACPLSAKRHLPALLISLYILIENLRRQPGIATGVGLPA
jgi:hypothetical protein